ncbi:MAG: hypothetical protein ACRDRA_08155, partial [Pseudonocardiaceae bacterium]
SRGSQVKPVVLSPLETAVVKGRGGFSLETPKGVRFLIRSRLLTNDELAELDAWHHVEPL